MPSPVAVSSSACSSDATPRPSGPVAAPVVAATSSRRPSERATEAPARSAIPERMPTSSARVASSTGQSERPVSATGAAATAITCPSATTNPEAVRWETLASWSRSCASNRAGTREVTTAVVSSP